MQINSSSQKVQPHLASLNYRLATAHDVPALVTLENQCFTSDKISKRSFMRWVNSANGILLLAETEQSVLGYGLVYCHKGTRLARLYSMAVSPNARNMGLAKTLLSQLERLAATKERLFMRLEVAVNNPHAINLYASLGYKIFGEYCDYYQDHTDALRMQKKIQHAQTDKISRLTPWYSQTTEFTCGPAALMMAMASLKSDLKLDQALELALWREATTIFMTSGHGGCHPIGLALAAAKRQFEAIVYVNTPEPLFVEGVRTPDKKQIMVLVDEQYKIDAKQQNIVVKYEDVDQVVISDWLAQGYAVLVLISTYRLDNKKAPHWVTVTHIDDTCLYVHDPYLDKKQNNAFDCQYLPIARADFAKMASFGSNRLRTAVAIKPIT